MTNNINERMIEAGARAICRAGICGPKSHLDEQEDLHWRNFELEAKACLEAALAEMWLPIESAPKEGVFIAYAKDIYGKDDAVWKEMIRTTYKMEHGNNGSYAGFSTHFPPTHWMPLPTPPKEKG